MPLALLFLGVFSLTCEQGFVPNALSICIEPRYIEGCHQYKSETACKVCDYRYVLQPDGLCEFDKDSTEECCASRAGDGSCNKCKTGLYMVDGKCQESNILGCLEKDSLGLCINCASGIPLYYFRLPFVSRFMPEIHQKVHPLYRRISLDLCRLCSRLQSLQQHLRDELYFGLQKRGRSRLQIMLQTFHFERR